MLLVLLMKLCLQPVILESEGGSLLLPLLDHLDVLLDCLELAVELLLHLGLVLDLLLHFLDLPLESGVLAS